MHGFFPFVATTLCLLCGIAAMVLGVSVLAEGGTDLLVALPPLSGGSALIGLAAVIDILHQGFERLIRAQTPPDAPRA